MALPIFDVVRPSVLAGQTNGRLPDSILVDTPGQAGGPTVRLVAPAARAWRAMCAAARSAGHILKTTSLDDSYRRYDVQERVFRQRYTTTVLAGQPYRLWDSDKSGTAERWYQLPDTAPAAVPGTSNHGWGLAADTGEERDPRTGTESLDDATLAWLTTHEVDFGFSHELVAEPWHIRYFTGDAIPAAVIAFEIGGLFAMLPEKDQQAAIWRIEALLSNRPSVLGGPTVGEPNALAAEIAGIKADIAGVKADIAALQTGMVDGIAQIVTADLDARLAAVLAKLAAAFSPPPGP